MSRMSKPIIGRALLIVLFGALLVQLPIAIAARATDYEWFDPIVDVRALLLAHYVETPDESAMQQAMIHAMIDTLEDPYTAFVPPSEEAEFNKDLRGTYVGIGAEVDIVDDYLTIVSPMDGSPALEAGVLAGDVVLEIEGKSTYKLTIDECINTLMGEAGTPVRVKVRHLDGSEQELQITRRQIVTHTVRGIRRDGEAWDCCIDGELGLSYVRVTQFNGNTIDDLRELLMTLQEKGLNGLVLDLRDNPGGALTAALDMADLFLASGTIVSVKAREGESRSWQAQADGTLPDFPLVVLINGNAASASEIVAGALQDNDRARIIGSRTYGKGSVQEVRELPDKRGTLKFTSAYYFLPNGRNIHRRPSSDIWGVDPDPGYAVPMSIEQYREMVLARRDYDAIRSRGADSGPCNDSTWVLQKLHDVQLDAALRALRTRVRSGEWAPVGEDEPTLIALQQEIDLETQRRMRLLELLNTSETRLAQLTHATAEAGADPLLPPDIDLSDGTLALRDKHGNVIGTYRIESGDVELALQALELEPVDPPAVNQN